MNIPKKVVLQSVRNITSSGYLKLNSLGGLLALFYSVDNISVIEDQTAYEVYSDTVGNLLKNWFGFIDQDERVVDNNKKLHFILSTDWSNKFVSYVSKKDSNDVIKPKIADYALFVCRCKVYKDHNIYISQIVEDFKIDLKLDHNDLNTIFDMEYNDYLLDLEDSYSQEDLLIILKDEFSIDNIFTTISLDSNSVTTISSSPASLSQAPFIQTLYSGMQIQNIVLLNNSNLSEAYNLGSTKAKPTKTNVSNTIYYGAPGTGKSRKVTDLLEDVSREYKETVTFHPDYDYVSFVGGYKPISEKDSNGDESIKYKFVPQVFTNIYVNAWKNPQEQFYLVIEEINRGNCAEIFGDIFQLLDQNQKYTVTPSSELKAYLVQELSEHLEGIADGLKMPNNLSILATMNTSDQSLFPMDSAFKRRWDWEYIPINYDKSNNPSSEFIVEFDDGTYFSWLDFIGKVNAKIKDNHNLGMDKCIGNYFINPTDNIISLNTFINKAIFYLWNDVFKDESGSETIFAKGMSYEDFFPVKNNGAQMVRALLETLNFKLLDDKYTVANEDTN
ncbi:McrB family protein [Psychrobacter proteolyticus]|uniref:McrB family protein n=1 Tax=Psychrobacter proteolyticus TaxID=147825 RepID=UPI003D039E97